MLLNADIRRTIEKEIESLEKSLASGAASDYAHYRELVGMVAGMQRASELAVEVVKQRVEFPDDDDEE